jgi:hypothetical protein
MYRQRIGARSEYRQQEGQRVKDSATLSDTFRKLKSLTAILEYYAPEGDTKTSQIKYVVNLANAKSVFRFSCPNSECVRGDFDLSEELATGIRGRQKTINGKMICQGWRSKTTIDTVHCNNILRYTLSLGY